MRPVLDQPQARRAVPGVPGVVGMIAVPSQAVELGPVVAAEAGEQRQVVRPAQDVDRVELDQPEAADGGDEIVGG